MSYSLTRVAPRAELMGLMKDLKCLTKLKLGENKILFLPFGELGCSEALARTILLK